MQKLQELMWLWMVLGFTILPALRQFLVQLRRKLIIARVERARGTKVITRIWKSGYGIPLVAQSLAT